MGLVTSLDVVIMTYRYSASKGQWCDVNQWVNLTQTLCHYGNTRPWFVCPSCKRRTAFLYLAYVSICRRCAQLVYPSQSSDVIERSWLRTWKIESKVGASGGKLRLSKPKRMRWATHARLMHAWVYEIALRDDMVDAYARDKFPEWF